ncbi:LysR family transcriptional regulator [Roseomonas sp. CECT 9278]|uniref:LysR family transcriptional regulator n=1 Tax=Roseomonas sp. CECT 9278 TaxID=2845823 RepID=UPI001E45F913|nr:LysR family transcriptional regulator [Roseomonas sp. CECT 9278]CAH0125672.1 Hca operon transcriptional activator HcaR [Roseomonas sp. CECT 9278]
MDLVQIRHFLALACRLNFTRAAADCNTTQPTLSRSIQRLEDVLGGPLVRRERSLTQLTELGRAMLPLLQSTHDAAEAVRTHAAAHRCVGGSAALRIGLAPSVPVCNFSALFMEVATRVRGFEMNLRRTRSPELVEAMLHGTLDLAVLPESEALPDRLNTWPLWQESVAVVLPEGHRLAAHEQVEAAELEGETLVEAEPPAACAFVPRGLASKYGLRLRAVHRGEEAEVGLLVALGLGIALVPAGTILPRGAVMRPLVAPAFDYRVLLCAVAGRPMNRAGRAFVKLARATLDGTRPPETLHEEQMERSMGMAANPLVLARPTVMWPANGSEHV